MGNYEFLPKKETNTYNLVNNEITSVQDKLKKMEKIQMSDNQNYGWSIDKETYQKIFVCSPEITNNVWEFCARDDKESLNVMNIFVGMIITSNANFKNKISVLFNLYRTSFDKLLTKIQVELLFEYCYHALNMYFHIQFKHNKQEVNKIELLNHINVLKEKIGKKICLWTNNI